MGMQNQLHQYQNCSQNNRWIPGMGTCKTRLHWSLAPAVHEQLNCYYLFVINNRMQTDVEILCNIVMCRALRLFRIIRAVSDRYYAYINHTGIIYWHICRQFSWRIFCYIFSDMFWQNPETPVDKSISLDLPRKQEWWCHLKFLQ